MKNMIKDAAVLLVITLIAGFVLGFVYKITKDPIEKSKEKAKLEAFNEVFSGASDYKDLEMSFPKSNADIQLFEEKGFGSVTIDGVYEATSADGVALGYVLNVTTSAGYGGNISFAMGMNMDGTINGISILEISETAGLGMRAEEVLKPQYANKKVSAFSVTKEGATVDNQIDAISGATITSNALTTAVNGGIYYFNSQLGGGNNEG